MTTLLRQRSYAKNLIDAETNFGSCFCVLQSGRLILNKMDVFENGVYPKSCRLMGQMVLKMVVEIG